MFDYLSAHTRTYVIVAWGGVLSLVIASLMVSHWVSLPRPAIGDSFASLNLTHLTPTTSFAGGQYTSIGQSFAGEQTHEMVSKRDNIWAFHVIYQSCPCSRRVLKHLLERTVIVGASETILLVLDTGDHASTGLNGPCQSDEAAIRDQAIARGYLVQAITPEELRSSHGIEASPLLLIVDAEGIVLFSGGYTSRKRGLSYQDEATIQAVLNGETPDPIPVFGCAVSEQLQKIVDPLGLKY